MCCFVIGQILRKSEVLWCLHFQGQVPVLPLVPQDEGTVMFQNIMKYLLNNIAPCPGRLDSSAILL
jgi:hypothetical protein